MTGRFIDRGHKCRSLRGFYTALPQKNRGLQSTAKMPGAKGNKSDKKSGTKQPQSPKDQPKKTDQKGDEAQKQAGQPKGEKQ